jgi:hypothetical protein
VVAALLILTACQEQSPPEKQTILLGGTYNINGKCVGHSEGLCGPEDKLMPVVIVGIFATEPDCQGIKLRALTEKERGTPRNQLPFLLDVYYMGTHNNQSYTGNGKGEDEGWSFSFNGPRGHFTADARTEQELVSLVCKAAKGLGAEIDKSVGYAPSK